MNETEPDKQAGESQELVEIARIVRTRGLKGELVADLLTDIPERFDGLDEVFAVSPDGARQQVKLEAHWFQRDRIILKFTGYDSIEAAKVLVGCQVAVSESDRIQLPADSFYDWELAGSEVRNLAGELLGHVREVMRTPGGEMLLIEKTGGGEALVPMVREICVQIDIAGKLIRVDPPAGLLEL